MESVLFLGLLFSKEDRSQAESFATAKHVSFLIVIGVFILFSVVSDPSVKWSRLNREGEKIMRGRTPVVPRRQDQIICFSGRKSGQRGSSQTWPHFSGESIQKREGRSHRVTSWTLICVLIDWSWWVSCGKESPATPRTGNTFNRPCPLSRCALVLDLRSFPPYFVAGEQEMVACFHYL